MEPRNPFMSSKASASTLPCATNAGLPHASSSTNANSAAAPIPPQYARSASSSRMGHGQINVTPTRAPTPLKIEALRSYLHDYPSPDKEFLLDGLEYGFHIPFEGALPPLSIRNHKSVCGFLDCITFVFSFHPIG